MSERSDKEKRLRDSQAKSYDAWYMERGYGSVFIEDSSVITALDIKKTDVILDVGCGTGRITSQLAEKCDKCFGIDISEKSIEILKGKNISNLSCDVIDISAEDIPYDVKFDKILSMQVIQHLEPEQHDKACRKIYDALKDGGTFVCELYNFSGFQRKKEIIRQRTQKITALGDFYEYRFSANEFADLMKKIGYRKVECYGVCNFSRRNMNRFYKQLIKAEMFLHRLGLSKYLGYYFIVECQK